MSDTVELQRRARIVELHAEIGGLFRTGIDKAIQIGRLLCEQKSELPHGQFGQWIAESLPFTDRTARNYMRIFENRERLKTETVSDLTAAYRLLSAPGPHDDSLSATLGEFLDTLMVRVELSQDIEEVSRLVDFVGSLQCVLTEYTLRLRRFREQVWSDDRGQDSLLSAEESAEFRGLYKRYLSALEAMLDKYGEGA